MRRGERVTKAQSKGGAELRPAYGSRAYRGRVLTALSPPAEAPSNNGARGPELLYLEDGLLAVDDSGRITQVAPFDRSLLTGPVINLQPCLLLPGLVDAHTHFPQTRITGSASGELLDWLEKSVFPEEARFHEQAYARTVAKEFIARMLQAGTTTCAAFSSSMLDATNTLFEELDASGMRAVTGLTLMDQRCPEALRLPRREAMDACKELIERWHGHDQGRLMFAVTPRFAPSCSRRLMEDAAELAARHKLHVHTHISENATESVEAREAHPYGEDYLGIYEKVGLVTARTLFAHAIHLSPSEWDRIAERGASVVHCPDSNFFLGSGRMQLHEPRSRRIPVALGSDVAAGRTFDMRRAMSNAHDNALCTGSRLTPEELFTLGTLGGARALGMEAQIGSLEPGKEADFIAMRVPHYAQSRAEVVAQIAFAGDGGIVERAFVRGREVFARGLR